MKGLKEDLESLVKDLRAMAKKTEKIEKKLENLQKVQARKKSKAKAKVKAAKKRVAKKTKKVAAIDTVLAIIKKSRIGVDTATLKKKTGFNNKKIWNIINSLKRQGKVKSEKTGAYVKA